MSTELALRFATDELERTLKQAEAKRAAWQIARLAHPSVLDIDAAIACADAACELAEAQVRFEEAMADRQAEYFEQSRADERSDSSNAADPIRSGRTGDRGSVAFGEPLAQGPTPSKVLRTVRFPAFIPSRVD